MVSFDIIFDNDTQGVFFSGQTLSGSVQIINEKKRSIKGIKLKIEGYAKCKWGEQRTTGQNTMTIYYIGKEEYMNTLKCLVGSNNGNSIDLAEGTHQFNFSCSLPKELPTSLESKYGSIRYQIKIEIERPWKKDIKHCFGFTVIKPTDLNYESQVLMIPFKAEGSKKFFLGLSSKNLYMTAHIPFCGYVSGQTANIDISVNNESSVEVTEIFVELMKMFNYNSDTPKMKTRRREESTSLIRLAGIAPKSKSGFSASLIIPAVPPSNYGTCRVVQIFYEIHVTAVISGLHRNLTITLPITIGTVPLADSYQNGHPSLQTEQVQSDWNIQASTSQAPFPPIATAHAVNLPPLSYQEAITTTAKKPDNDEGITDQDAYNPMYPVFNFANQQAKAQYYQSNNEKNEKL